MSKNNATCLSAASASKQVQLFVPCYVDQFFPEVAEATVRVLEVAGWTVFFPREQTCCGQPAFNSGYWREAHRVARTWLAAFRPDLPVVAPSGSCVSMVRHFYRELPWRRAELRRWQDLKPQVYELSQFLVSACGLRQWQGKLPLRVAFHDACHALRELGIREEPRLLLSGIQGLELVEPAEPEVCCGFGGTFSVKFPELSTAMAERKARALVDSAAQAVVSTDMSCLMQIGGFLQKQGYPIRAWHLAQVLAAAVDPSFRRGFARNERQETAPGPA
ncbi:MAG: (Fe-S)-binding protein [Calditrichaeota bacterium]|nr:MAG: (Fe-S)-binding protein [Calditrichota bacterium]